MGQPALKEDDLYYTDMPVGEILRRTREHYGQTVLDIERAILIRDSQIDAIERGAFEELPGRVYIIGFIRSYSEYLGLDGDRMVNLFKLQSDSKARNPELHFPVGASDTKLPPFWLVGLSLLAALAVMFIWMGLQGRDRSVVTDIPPLPEHTRNQTAMDKPMTLPNAPMGPFIPPEKLAQIQQAQKKEIILNIRENSWVEIKDAEGQVIVSRILNAGDTYFVPDRPDLNMSLGNAGGVELEIGVQKLLLGKAGDVIRDVPLDAKKLTEQYGEKTADHIE